MAPLSPNNRPRFAGLIITILAILIFPLLIGDVTAQANASSEDALKAAFLFHFAQFTQWPPNAFNDAKAPLVFCTLGEDAFQGELDQILSGQTIGNRPLRAQHLTQLQGAQGCHIIFVGADETKHIPDFLSSLKDAPVLTVGDSEHFAVDGGMIGLYLEEDKIRFDINLTSVQHAKLTISAKLLALAKTVMGRSKGN